jgi:hypothetical protein
MAQMEKSREGGWGCSLGAAVEIEGLRGKEKRSMGTYRHKKNVS